MATSTRCKARSNRWTAGRLDGWNWEQRVNETLQRLHLDPQAVVNTLSGGTKKRVALAQALVAQPDVTLCAKLTKTPKQPGNQVVVNMHQIDLWPPLQQRQHRR